MKRVVGYGIGLMIGAVFVLAIWGCADPKTADACAVDPNSRACAFDQH